MTQHHLSGGESRLQRGKRALAEIDGEADNKVVAVLADIAPDFASYLLEFPFGDIYSRPGLDIRSREIATIAALAAMGNATPRLKVHIEAGSMSASAATRSSRSSCRWRSMQDSRRRSTASLRRKRSPHIASPPQRRARHEKLCHRGRSHGISFILLRQPGEGGRPVAVDGRVMAGCLKSSC
jgi:alkylhydroperoxidase/carboxymuconolactone decarboxylase family protein YurZ